MCMGGGECQQTMIEQTVKSVQIFVNHKWCEYTWEEEKSKALYIHSYPIPFSPIWQTNGAAGPPAPLGLKDSLQLSSFFPPVKGSLQWQSPTIPYCAPSLPRKSTTELFYARHSWVYNLSTQKRNIKDPIWRGREDDSQRAEGKKAGNPLGHHGQGQPPASYQMYWLSNDTNRTEDCLDQMSPAQSVTTAFWEIIYHCYFKPYILRTFSVE